MAISIQRAAVAVAAACALLVLACAGCRKPVANAAELTADDPAATTPTATPHPEWEAIADLPDCPPAHCTGPRMGMPNWTCPDGRTGGPVCKRMPGGDCAWTVVRCPPAEPRTTHVPRPTVAVSPTPPVPTPTATTPRAQGLVTGSAAEAVADACAKPCPSGQERRGILRCMDEDRRIRRVAGAINCPAFSIPREDRPAVPACTAFAAETSCAKPTECLEMDGTCCEDDGRLVVPTGSLGNMYCGSPGQRCNRCRCLPGDARVATPDGDRALSEIAIGDRIWTQAADGRRVTATVLEVARVPAPPAHRLLEVALEDGRVVRGSPTHPAADGTPLETFTVGTRLDGSSVVEARLLPLPVSETYDVLPAGETGVYWVEGVRLRSTIPPARGFLTSEALPPGRE